MASLVTSVRQLKRKHVAVVIKELVGHPHYPRMKALADELISGERMYSTRELVGMLVKKTSVSADRAANGVAMLKELNILLPTGNPELFYLNGSTPF